MKQECRAPTRLSPEAKKLWTSISDEFSVDDPSGLQLLGIVCESLDLMRKAQARVKVDGLTCRDRYGAIRAHPMLATIRDARSAMLAALRDLHLDIEPPARGAGRLGRTS